MIVKSVDARTLTTLCSRRYLLGGRRSRQWATALPPSAPELLLRPLAEVIPFQHLSFGLPFLLKHQEVWYICNLSREINSIDKRKRTFFTIGRHHNHSVAYNIESAKTSTHLGVLLLPWSAYVTYYPHHSAVCNHCFLLPLFQFCWY